MISEYHMVHYWCHSCRCTYLQDSDCSSFQCARCHSELVEEIPQNEAHPSNFVPDLDAQNLRLHNENAGRSERMIENRNIVINNRIPLQPEVIFYAAFVDEGQSFNDLINLITRLTQERQGLVPANEATINSLPVLRGSEVSGECSICQESFKPNEQARKMPCGHNFHNGCLVRWLQIRNSCPTCRTSTDHHNSSSSCI
ncbi:unnamed protein product [Blepharisma stoltei]|uniref:RING-type domain-containing protein n=1 Tax=Blepharisma stoltei TaxID=1481888 RepID=A0AAU9IDC4_9CILI|nr:unnamed protein product [Blepharisma stoltei]